MIQSDNRNHISVKRSDFWLIILCSFETPNFQILVGKVLLNLYSGYLLKKHYKKSTDIQLNLSIFKKKKNCCISKLLQLLANATVVCYHFSIFRLFQKFLLILVCPVVQIFFACLITTTEERYKGSWDLVERSFTNMKHGLLLTIIDRYLFGSWMYGLFCLAILPSWLVFWTIVHCDL